MRRFAAAVGCDAPVARLTSLRPERAVVLPLVATLAIVAMGLLPSVRQNARVLWSFWGVAAALLTWNVWLLATSISRGRTFALDVVLRKQHYLQACAQGFVLLYWGWYWRQVYDSAHLIAAQLLFAYAFDMLLTWSRRESYALGFGPVPVIFSINLFLWFKQDWFYLQFLLVAIGIGAKELIQWNKEGRRTHIFNPSSFPLALFSIVLIVTGSTNMTWGPEIANTQFYPPQIYLTLFLVGLPGQVFFGVTTMTMMAVVTTYVFGLLYFVIAGTYFFFDSYVPIAVFLGMHLLFTDPSTSPRTELGRIIFGTMYGLSTVACYAILGVAGVPTFYDKLLPVPILNLTIKIVDRATRSTVLKRLDPGALGRALAPKQRNRAYIAVWTTVFVTMSGAGGVGDRHPGHDVLFWQQACARGVSEGCHGLAVVESSHCQDGSGWACNELGILIFEKRVSNFGKIEDSLQRACQLGFAAGCKNFRIFADSGGQLRSAPPRLVDYPLLLREGKGPLPDRTVLDVYTRACDRGWMSGCEGLAFMYLHGMRAPHDPLRAAQLLGIACNGGRPTACSDLGLIYKHGDGVQKDTTRGRSYLKRACDLGFDEACLSLINDQQAVKSTAGEQ